MTIPARIPNWDILVVDFATSVVGQPYQWGLTDCVSLWRRGQAVMRGVEDHKTLLPELGHWWSTKSAVDTWATLGGPLAALARVGAVAFPPTFAQTGDLLVIPPDTTDGHEQMYLLVSGFALVTSQADGVSFQDARPLLDRPGAACYRLLP